MDFGVSAAACITWRFVPGGGPTILYLVEFFSITGRVAAWAVFGERGEREGYIPSVP